MTNGEKFCIDFPNIRIEVFVSYVQVVGENYEFNNLYPLKWWNAEYKEPTTKENLAVDCIDRKKLIDWINIWDITPIIKNPLIRHIQGMSSVTPQEPTKNDLAVDVVRRKAVLNTLDNMDSALDEDDRTVETYKELLKECYKVLPSVTPIRPKGHWIPIYQGDEIIDYRCSECEFGNTFGKGTFGMNFCPRCGSYNGGVSNGNE